MEKPEKPLLKEVVKEDFMMEKEEKKAYDRRIKETNEMKEMKPIGRKKPGVGSSLDQL